MKLLIHDYAGHAFPVQLSRALARRGHAVRHVYAGGLLTPRGGLERRADDPSEFAVIEAPMSPAYRRDKYSFLKRRFHEASYGRGLARLVAAERPDVIISGNTPSEPQWIMIQEARRLGAPVLAWVQDFYSLAVERLARRRFALAGALAGKWCRWLDRRCFAASAGVIAITEDFRPMLREFGVGRERIAVVPNWAPLEEFPECPRRNAWAARHRIADTEAFVFLYAGTLAMKHNPDLLVQLAERFRGDPAVRIAVVSEGPGADHLRRESMARGLRNLRVLNFQPYAQMPETLAAADVLVAVLEEDAGVFSVPSKVLTYHCARRPILAAMPLQNLAARIVLGHGGGLVVGPGDVEGFLAAAERLRGDAALRARLGARARAYAEETFDIEAIATRFETLACEAAKHPTPTRGWTAACGAKSAGAAVEAAS